jgi:hypothetical protein
MSFLSALVKIAIYRQFFEKIFRYETSRKFVQWEQSRSMRTNGRTDRQTDTTELIVAFRNFANAPKNRQRSSVRNLKYTRRQPNRGGKTLSKGDRSLKKKHAILWSGRLSGEES